jgi:hypothetical protein
VVTQVELTGVTGEEILRVMTEADRLLTMNTKDFRLASLAPSARKVIDLCIQRDLLKAGLYGNSLVNPDACFYCDPQVPSGFYVWGLPPPIGARYTPRDQWVRLSRLRSFVLAANLMGVIPNGEVIAPEGVYNAT